MSVIMIIFLLHAAKTYDRTSGNFSSIRSFLINGSGSVLNRIFHNSSPNTRRKRKKNGPIEPSSVHLKHRGNYCDSTPNM